MDAPTWAPVLSRCHMCCRFATEIGKSPQSIIAGEDRGCARRVTRVFCSRKPTRGQTFTGNARKGTLSPVVGVFCFGLRMMALRRQSFPLSIPAIRAAIQRFVMNCSQMCFTFRRSCLARAPGPPGESRCRLTTVCYCPRHSGLAEVHGKEACSTWGVGGAHSSYHQYIC